MRKNTKKGFTLVELVIVIAVIAVLSAIIIPVTSSIVQNAKETVDKTTVKALNEALARDEAKNGKHTLYGDVLDAMKEYGYGVDKLTPVSLGDILWDSVNNTFILKKDGKEVMRQKGSSNGVKDVDLWMVAKSVSDIEKPYSKYLASGFDFGKTIDNLHTGIDVGEYAVNVNYSNSNAQTVIINTNGGFLTIDAPNDTVNHYGSAGYVGITAVANESYHEFGDVGEIKLEKGRTVVEKEGKVGSVMVTATTANNVKIENNNGTIGGVAAKDSTVAGVLKEKVTGVDESKVLTTAVDNSKFAGGLGTEESPYLISTAEQFKNISGEEKHYKLIDDIETSKLVNVVDGQYEYTAIIDTLEKSTLDGDGHKVTILDSSFFVFKFYSSTIKNIEISLKKNLSYFGSFSTFENVDVEGSVKTSGGNEGIYLIYCEPQQGMVEMTFIDCDCSADFTSDGAANSYNAVFAGYAYPNHTTVLNYANCTYSGTFISGKSAMFLGNNSANLGNVTININNCENKGIIQATYTASSYNFNSYLACGIASSSTDRSYTNNKVVLNGVQLTADKISGPLSTGFVQGPNDKSLKLKQNVDGTFTVTQSDSSKSAYYIVSIKIYSSYREGGTLVQGVEERIEASSFENKIVKTALKELSFVDKEWVDKNKAATATIVGSGDYSYTVYALDGKEYYYLPNTTTATLNGEVGDRTFINVSCFDANGNLLASAALTK